MILIRSLTRSLLLPLICAVAFFTIVPAGHAEIPPDQIKAAGAIPLTTDLLDKMDKFIKSVSTDDAAKAELVAVNKDPSITPETWGESSPRNAPRPLKSSRPPA